MSLKNLSAALLLLVSGTISNTTEASEKKINDNWKFSLGDITEAKNTDFDCEQWRTLRLPHDWSFELGYSQHGAQKDKGGYLSGGIGWYRKTFNISDNEINNKLTFIDFDAVYMNSEVWINGHYLGKYPYGYNSFSYELTPHLKDGENVIAVRVDNSLEPSARWYHGCGIYGDVFLRSENPVHLEKNSTYITTPSKKLPTGEVKVSTVINNRNVRGVYKVEWIVKSLKGKNLDKTVKTLNLKEGANPMKADLKLNKFELWSPENPTLYNLTMIVRNQKGTIVDTETTRFGFRSINWDPKTGFHLNGKQTKLRGVCEHLEGGPTGAFWTEGLLRWKLQLIKDMGCNAVRVAHNPQVPVFYDLCDEMGILVMDEIFDGWHKKADFDYGMQAYDDWWEIDTRAWVRRNRNHPSIFIYSVGNETRGEEAAANLVRVCHEEDPTRKVTSGHSESELMDVFGVNGHSEKKSFLDNYIPTDKAFVATENPHTWQVRGYYRTRTWYRDGYPSTKQEPQYIADLTEKEIFAYDWTSPDKRRNRKQVFNSSYDNATVRVTARHLIEALRDKDWFSGSFRWTGFDYLGEAGYVHGGWPFRAFQSGALDLAGFEKDLYYLYQAEWSNEPMVHMLPHWTHPRMEVGTEIPVWVYTNGDAVELFQDGVSLGKKQKGKSWDRMQCEWLVAWKEGKLEAVAYKKGKEIARTEMVSSQAPSRLKVVTNNHKLKADAEDIAIVTITQTDANGTHYPYGENRQAIKINGDARVLSFENGSPVDVETNFGATSRCSFMGKNRIFIQSSSRKEDPISLTVASISGDKKLDLSDLVTINVVQLALRGKLDRKEYEIHYTTDGTKPTKKSALYTKPFKVALGTTVKAVVFEGNKPVITLEERFAEDAGLYWGVAGEEPCAFSGEQAEHATLTNAMKLRKDGDGFYGDGYVVTKPNEGSITWYQENDGGKMSSNIMIRYSLDKDVENAKMELWNNDEKISEIDFKPTGSPASHWSERIVPITIYSGANNITLKSVSDTAPSIDQITIIQ